ncbi:MAG: FAD-dependent oxidoreductase, partial [bacterium]|nr:FAD-dependent oxidoreductase [bacterium]
KQNFPGFENSHRRDRGGFSIGVRETRRVMGEYLLTEEDILQGKKFLDGIGCNCTPMDIHSSGGHQSWTQVKTYDIPYRCLISATIDNLLMSGRCISATHKALASVRFIPCCVITGQAAGTAAALTSKGDISLKELDTNKLLAELKGQGVILTAGNV